MQLCGTEVFLYFSADLSGSDDHSGTEDEDPITRRRRRRRRRKRKAGVVSEPGEAGARETPPQGGATAPLPEGPEGGNKPEPHSAEGPERLSRNKKRKMKKKRHKEKLVSLGLVPRPRALEFTYTHGGEDQGVEDHAEETQQNLDEIVDEIEAFLRSTMDLCLSDRSSGVGRPSLAADVAESLFARMSDRTLPPTGLTGLCRLGALLAQRDVGKLNAALQEFSSTSTLSTAETAVVCTLFHYWITDILPVQKERNS
ncbi:uncharacterized protein erich1 [Brachyhypopomus gauderio]|uniref:uncharacterized protein erich1 n=1 Tax=Brachyhypopomus gauderio TaxID=698409 RepID=UPI0040418346